MTGDPGMPARGVTRAREQVCGARLSLCPQHCGVRVAGGKTDASFEAVLIEPHAAAARAAVSLDAITVGRHQVGIWAVRGLRRV